MSDNLKGVWIDGGVWECEALTLTEKHFLQKIKDLDNDKGCFAMNAYFSEFFGVSKGRCSQIIKSLEKKEMIKITLERKGKQVSSRVINILNRGVKLFKQGVKNIKLGGYYSKYPYLENAQENNIELNNRIKNLEEREKEALSKIQLLESELKKATAELKNLKTEKKKKEKSSAKKENEVPPTEDELPKEDKPYFFDFLKPFPFNGWSKELKNNFYLYCQRREDKEKQKNARYSYSDSGIKDSIRQIESVIAQYGIKIAEIAVQEATPSPWVNLQPEKVKNRLERERIKELSNQSDNEDGTPSYMMGHQ